MPNLGLSPNIENQLSNSYFTFVRRFGRTPTWKELQNDIRGWMERTVIDDSVDDLGRFLDSTKYINLYSIPSQATLNKKMRDLKKRIPETVLDGSHMDSQWSLGSTEWSQLPAEASGVLMQMWKYSITNPDAIAAGFTVRQAQWVNKLRWVSQAGGSIEGQIIDAGLMYKVSSAYTARERYSEDTKQKRCSTAPLDAQLMLDPNVVRLASLAGHEGLDEPSETWLTDLAHYNPYLSNLIRTEGQINREVRTGFNQSLQEMKYVTDQFDHLDSTGELINIANDMLHFAMEIAKKDPRWELINKAQAKDVGHPDVATADGLQGRITVDMMLSILNAWKAGTEKTWEPPLDNLGLIEKAFSK